MGTPPRRAWRLTIEASRGNEGQVDADEAELEPLVARAGFEEIRIETVTKTTHFRSVAEYVHVQLAATPLASTPAA